jgi:pimeloyl-ACP methyl ester carboxylesterase
MRPMDGLERHGQHNKLYVVLHRYCSSPKALLPIRRAIRKIDPDADIYAPRMPFAGWLGWLCLRDATTVVRDLIASIDRIVEDRNSQPGPGYQAINLVGHSMGAVLARKIAIIAHGEPQLAAEDRNLYAPFEAEFEAYAKSPRSWARLIRRLVLMAGMNRGWSPSSAMNWLTAIKWRASTAIGEMFLGGKPIIFDIRRGAVFSVQTRLQWLALMHRRKKDRPNLIVVQLLGAVDDVVAPDDSVDYAVDTNDENDSNEDAHSSVHRSYFYLEVPRSGHKDIIKLVIPDLPDVPPQDWTAPSPEQLSELSRTASRRLSGILRYIEFWHALKDSPAVLRKRAVRRSQMSDSLPPAPDRDVTDVVFVIHGIRDKGFWTQKVARAIKEKAAAGRDKIIDDEPKKMNVRSVTTSYGYFAMAPFVLWWIRKGKAEWLMDQYTEARAHYPEARFSYVGHSNGTYLVARALKDYPAARFRRIVLAGSVVRRDYRWMELIDKGRVEKVLNYVATGDWVVGWFTNGMQLIRILDLGGAGHVGFREASPDGPVHQVCYIKGAHGAGHEERHWPDIARFIVSGCVPKRDAQVQNRFVKRVSHASIAIVLGLLIGALWFGSWLGRPALCQIPKMNWFDACAQYDRISGAEGAWRTFVMIIYFWAVYITVSRL